MSARCPAFTVAAEAEDFPPPVAEPDFRFSSTWRAIPALPRIAAALLLPYETQPPVPFVSDTLEHPRDTHNGEMPQRWRLASTRLAHRLRRLAVQGADEAPGRVHDVLLKEVRSTMPSIDADWRTRFLAEVAAHFPSSEDEVPPAWWIRHVAVETTFGAADTPRATAAPTAEAEVEAMLPPQEDFEDDREPLAAPEEISPFDDGPDPFDGFEPIEQTLVPFDPPVKPVAKPIAKPVAKAAPTPPPVMKVAPVAKPAAVPAPPAKAKTPMRPPAIAAQQDGPDLAGFTLIGDDFHDSGSVTDGRDALAADLPDGPDVPPSSPIYANETEEVVAVVEVVEAEVEQADDPVELLARLRALRRGMSSGDWQSAIKAAGATSLFPAAPAAAPARAVAATVSSSPAVAQPSVNAAGDEQQHLTDRFWKIEPEIRRRWKLSSRDVIDPTRAVELADVVGPHVVVIDKYVRAAWSRMSQSVAGASSTLIASGPADVSMSDYGGLTQAMLFGSLTSHSRLDAKQLKRALTFQRNLVTGLITAINGMGRRLNERVLGRIDPQAIWQLEMSLGDESKGGGWLGRGGDPDRAAKARCWERYTELFTEIRGHGGSGLDVEVIRNVVEFVEPVLAAGEHSGP